MARTIARLQPILVMLLVAGALAAWNGSHSGPGHAEYPVKEVEIEQAKALIASGAAVVDVREQDAYEGRHIPGAIVVPLAALRAGIPASIVFAKDQPIVVYCGEGTSRGPEGAYLLNQAGYAGAVNLKSGIQGWANAGMPVKVGKAA